MNEMFYFSLKNQNKGLPGSVVRICLSGEGTGSSRILEDPMLHSSLSPGATATEPVLWSLGATASEARGPQEKPPQWKACSPTREKLSPHLNLERNLNSKWAIQPNKK